MPLCVLPPLDFDTSILPICKDSLGWMFNKLDMNFDLLLDQSELSAIFLDKYEMCMKPLFNSCDSFKDGKLSNNEWCYCFQKPEGEDARDLQYITAIGNSCWPFEPDTRSAEVNKSAAYCIILK